MTISEFTITCAALALCLPVSATADNIDDAIGNSHRAEANRERDGDRHPDQVLEFIGLEQGGAVLDWGSGGGYWAELFAGVAGSDGRVHAQQRAGERFEARKDELTRQFAPFGNIKLLPTENGEPIPLGDASVDVVMLSYIYHHMHYVDGSGEGFPASSRALLGEFLRVLKPGGALIVIEHAAADGSGRAQSGG
ncbi:MAG: methyltransferase domain-containing protein, partial [Gammaproteobacteria bacterium]|nr:methyltransferase domain-containing protein [Gammaproteobacteria bacterium]